MGEKDKKRVRVKSKDKDRVVVRERMKSDDYELDNIPPSASCVLTYLPEDESRTFDDVKCSPYSITSSVESGTVKIIKEGGDYQLKLTEKGKKAKKYFDLYVDE